MIIATNPTKKHETLFLFSCEFVGFVADNISDIKRPENRSGLFLHLSQEDVWSAATFESATGHVRTVTAVCSDNTTATVYDMITARLCCRLIAFFLFIFVVHDNTSQLFCICFLSNITGDAVTMRSLINRRIHQPRFEVLKENYVWVSGQTYPIGIK